MNFPKFVWISVLGLVWFVWVCGSFQFDLETPVVGLVNHRTCNSVKLRMIHMTKDEHRLNARVLRDNVLTEGITFVDL